MRKYNKCIKLFGKKWQVKHKSLAYYMLEYVIPTMQFLAIGATVWGIIWVITACLYASGMWW